MFEFAATTHHPSIQATFIAKKLFFTLIRLFEFFSSELKVNFSVAQSSFSIAKRISKVLKKKKRESNVYFSDIGFFIRSWRPNPRLAAAGQFSPQIEKVNLFTSSTQSPPTSSPSRLKCTGHRIAWFYFFPWFLPSCWCCCHYKM